jgi:hypothetical protein
MSFARSNATPRARLRQAAWFQVEGLERRVLLSSAIAAFNPQQAFPTGTNPLALAVADVNRDGKLDLIVANNTDGNVGVLLGDGTGPFLNQATFASGPTPIAVAVADVNGDGKPDILVANYGSSSVSVLLGNGDGTFQNPQSFATGNEPIALTTADVNGDGRPDILVANYASGTVSVLDGNGDGTFQPQQTFAAGAHPISIAAADLNRDGKADIAVSNYTSSTVSVLLGTGAGTFSSPQTFAVGGKPRSIVVSDVNTDGKPDLIVVNKTDGTASILLGNGDGTFQTQITSYVGASPNAVAVADVNGDGKEDLVVANGGTTYPGNVAVLLGNRDGTFQPAVNFATGANPYALAVADLNGDGRLDIATANQRSNTVSVLLGDVPPTVLSINRASPPGPITSDSSVTYTVTFNEPVTGVDPTDFQPALTGGVTSTTPVAVSGTGEVYQVTINGISGTGTLGLNLVDAGTIKDAAGNPLQPGGTVALQPAQTFATGSIPYAVATADLNRDGKADAVVVNDRQDSVSVLIGNGDGTFQSQQTFFAGFSPGAVAIGDFNGDGKPDIAVADGNYSASAIAVLLGNGNGTFQPARTFATFHQPGEVGAFDVNGDGKPDLVFTSVISHGFGVMLGNGNGTFQPQLTFSVPVASVGSFAAADFNGDGKVDFALTGTNNDTIILLGNGDGTFRLGQTVAIGPFGGQLAAADVNRDGIPDLLVQQAGHASVLLGNGDGTFRPPVTYAINEAQGSLAVADMNGDGKLDLLLGNPTTSSVTILLGNGDGTFGAPVDFAAGPSPDPLVTPDVNSDGRLDVLVANVTSSTSTLSALLGADSDNTNGQLYRIVPSLDVISGTAGVDQLTIVQDADQQHIDWTLGSTTAQALINDPNGLTINGNGGNDVITLDYSNGNPLPAILHLNGTFAVNNLQGTNPLADTTLEIGKSTVFISYSSSDPIAAIQGYLQNGYDAGAWNGSPTATTGVITSAAAQANPNHNTAIGYADSADAQGVNTTPNTIELTYTLYGDANLDHQVNSADLQILLAFLNRSGSWDQGDFNYDGQVNSADLQALLFTLNTSLGSQATPMAVAATAGVATPPSAGGSSSSDPSPHRVPAIHATGTAGSAVPHPHPAKVSARKRR